MTLVMVDKDHIRSRALHLIAEDGQTVAMRLAQELGVSRQVASKHLQALLRQGLIAADGQTRSRAFRLVPVAQATRTYPRQGLSEDVVWQEVFRPVVADLPENVRDIWNYGVTEMVNNAIDHSNSPEVRVAVFRDAVQTTGLVADVGEGIFLKIQRECGLYDPREAILELAKGKLTTDPVNHTGEGIFFASRAFDAFVIRSGNISFMHNQDPFDVLIERPVGTPGTLVLMRLADDSLRILKTVFDEFAGPEEYTFSKTIVPVRLAQHEGEKLVSRSQAKRVSMRFERFRQVVLDFSQVVEIGQAFADELFRVFPAVHPGVSLTAANMTPEVERMVQRARRAAQEST